MPVHKFITFLGASVIVHMLYDMIKTESVIVVLLCIYINKKSKRKVKEKQICYRPIEAENIKKKCF